MMEKTSSSPRFSQPSLTPIAVHDPECAIPRSFVLTFRVCGLPLSEQNCLIVV